MSNRYLSLIVITVLAVGIIVLPSHNQASAAVADWQQGASIRPSSSTEFASSSFKESLSNLAGTNANFVTLVIPYSQSNIRSTDIQRSNVTPTDSSLVEAIKYAHSLGLGVNLMIHLGSRDGEWRALINPSDRAGWFKAYGEVLDHYAGIAQAHGVEQMTLGVELIKMAAATQNSTNTSYWRDMIRSVRRLYSGKLTYSANWGESGWVNEKDVIQFWDALDYIGISAYFEFSRPYTMASLRNDWDVWNNTHIKPLHEKYNKPVLFTEIGYRSTTGALERPWNYEINNGPNEQEQADGYEALFSYWNGHSFMQGVHLWEWDSDPDAGGPRSTSYTPQNKKAQGVMTRWFASGAPAPPPSPVAIALPGRIEAENYKAGGSGVGYSDTTAGNAGGALRSDDVDIEATTDTGSGYNVGWIAGGEWLTYDVDVRASGRYTMTARVASASTGTKTLHVEVDGVNVSGALSFSPTGGWQTWTNVSVSNVSLQAGLHTLRIVMDSDLFNVNYLEVSGPAPDTGPAPGGLPIVPGDVWRYHKGTSEPPAGWKDLGFNDSSWSSGPSGFGYGDGDDATVLGDMSGRYVSLYIRKTFTVTDPAAIATLTLSVDYDDGFVAYLNGVEVARANVTGAPPRYTYRATREREASRGNTSPQPVGTFNLTDSRNLLVTGTNVLTIQGHNKHITSSDFSLIPALAATTE